MSADALSAAPPGEAADRELDSPSVGKEPEVDPLLSGRRVVTVIGIDRYEHLPQLRCAVADALGVQRVLTEEYGFEAPIEPLLDERATRGAIESLVEDRLRGVLGQADSLLLFFAGHGRTRESKVGEHTVKEGYLAPVEAHRDRFADLLDLGQLLRRIGTLPARHILVVLDACHSGIALGSAARQDRSMEGFVRAMAGKVSRRVITSAREDEVASDTGPIPDHSLFTGMLIEGLRHGRAALEGTSGLVTASGLGQFLQTEVGRAPESRQHPDYGAFYLDDRGEMVLVRQVPAGPAGERATPGAAPAESGSEAEHTPSPGNQTSSGQATPVVAPAESGGGAGYTESTGGHTTPVVAPAESGGGAGHTESTGEQPGLTSSDPGKVTPPDDRTKREWKQWVFLLAAVASVLVGVAALFVAIGGNGWKSGASVSGASGGSTPLASPGTVTSPAATPTETPPPTTTPPPTAPSTDPTPAGTTTSSGTAPKPVPRSQASATVSLDSCDSSRYRTSPAKAPAGETSLTIVFDVDASGNPSGPVRYSSGNRVLFDGGVTVSASAPVPCKGPVYKLIP